MEAAQRLAPITALPRIETRAAIGERPECIWVNVRDLRVDHAYQRRIGARGEKLVRDMVAGWDWTLVQAITVTELPGGLWEVIDGQHRATAAASHGGIPMLPAMVLREGLDKPAAARAFVQLNTRRVAPTAPQLLKAAIAAREPDALTVWRATEAAGAMLYFLPPTGKVGFRPGGCIAASALLGAVRRYGEATLRAVLSLGVEAGLAPIRAEHLAALTLLATAPEWGLDVCDRARLVAALRQWEAVIDRADLAAVDSGQPKARARAAELYRRCAL